MKEIMEWVKDILLAVVIAAVILAFFKPIIVQQQSMEPNFHAGDYLIRAGRRIGYSAIRSAETSSYSNLSFWMKTKSRRT